MALHVIFINDDFDIISDVTSGFNNVAIPTNALIMRIVDDTKSYSNSTLTKLFEIDELYSKVLEYTTRGDFSYIDINVQNYNTNHTVIFNQLSAQFVGNLPPIDIYDFSEYGPGGGSSVDLSGVETALTNINTVLSGFTSLLSNLSNLNNLSQLANIITAINIKDNQSDIVDELRYIFTQSQNQPTYRSLNGVNNLSIFKGNYNATSLNNLDSLSHSNVRWSLYCISSKLSTVNDNVSNTSSIDSQNKFLYTLSKTMRALFSSTDSIQNLTISQIIDSSFLKSISDKLNNIETKLEQNLPFATLTDVTLNVDTVKKVVTQELNEKE